MQTIKDEPAGLLWTWWRGDAFPTLAPLTALRVKNIENIDMVVTLLRMSRKDVSSRFQSGHRVYIAYLERHMVGYGWSASNDAAFGSPIVHFKVPASNRYLYHFITVLRWRGLGIYPRLLQAIMVQERIENERFWIIHQQANIASQKGIAKAGFQIANKVYHKEDGKLGLLSGADPERAFAGAQLLGLSLDAEEIITMPQI